MNPTRLFFFLLLVNVFTHLTLSGQTGALSGNYQLLPEHSIRRTKHTPDTTVYVRCADDRSILSPKRSYCFFWNDSMQVLRYAETIISLGDTFLTSSDEGCVIVDRPATRAAARSLRPKLHFYPAWGHFAHKPAQDGYAANLLCAAWYPAARHSWPSSASVLAGLRPARRFQPDLDRVD
jgi:hypothetical protein